MPKKDAAPLVEEVEAPIATGRYEIKHSCVGTHYRGAVVPAEAFGTPENAQRLVDLGAIAETDKELGESILLV